MNMKKSNLLNFRAVLIFGIVILATLIGMEFIKAEQSRKGVPSFKRGRSYRSHSIPKFLTYKVVTYPQKTIDEFLNSDDEEVFINEVKIHRGYAQYIQEQFQLDSVNNTYFVVMSFLDISSVFFLTGLIFILGAIYIVQSEIKPKTTKIKYFYHATEQAFITSPNGERLYFSLGGMGVFSKPYIIPDEKTEKQLSRKHQRMLQVLIFPMIFGHAFLFPLFPAIIKTTPGLVYYFCVLFFVLQFTNWVVFRKDLSVLDRAPTRLPLSVISRYQAKRQSLFSLALGFFACMFYVVISSLAVKAGFKPLFGWGVILLFSLGGIACGYMSFLKLTISKENKNGINKMDAY